MTDASSATNEPIGAVPPPGTACSIADFDYQVRYQRAFEAILWSWPTVQVHHGRIATFDTFGIEDNVIVAASAVATPEMETWTANSSTPYIIAYSDLRTGPVVLEIPASGADGTLYGQVVDAWQLSIADVGPFGLDGGRGGKLLFTGPDHVGEIPDGYLRVCSPSHRIIFAFRSVVVPGRTAEDAFAYARRLRMYPLGRADDSPEQRFVDLVGVRYPTMLAFDETYFRYLHETITYEPARPQDRHIMGLLALLGIERERPFAPDDVSLRAMRQAAVDVWHYSQRRLDTLPRERYFWPDRHYVPLLLPDRNRAFSFEYPDTIDIDGRMLAFFWCTLVPTTVAERPATYYLVAMADADGNPLEPGSCYALDVPADVPAAQFWSLTVYDRATLTFVYTRTGRTTLDSYGLDSMVRNPDGGVTLYVGPQAPDGLEPNWIPTGGKRPMPTFRFYGPTDPLYDGTFTMPDFRKVS